MDRLYDCCCGLDVHKQTVVACLIHPVAGVGQTKTIRTFGTMTDEVDALADWLAAAGCTQVAMESTGVYWKPIFNRLDGRFAILVANAHHIKALPGRKTDVKDCEWIADLLQHGLLTASFIPNQAQRELRDLTRTRTTLIDERSRSVLRLQKVLEDANIKLAGVASDIMGSPGGRCSTRWWPGRPTRRCWPNWRRARCAPSGRSWSARSVGGWVPTIGCWWAGAWRTSTFWTSRSPN